MRECTSIFIDHCALLFVIPPAAVYGPFVESFIFGNNHCRAALGFFLDR